MLYDLSLAHSKVYYHHVAVVVKKLVGRCFGRHAAVHFISVEQMISKMHNLGLFVEILQSGLSQRYRSRPCVGIVVCTVKKDDYKHITD